MQFGKTLLAFAGTASIWTSMAAAGPYSEDLAKCLVKSTTKEDRVSLIRWLFAAASRHPAVSSIAKVSAAQLDEANKTIGELTMKLLTDSCKAEARQGNSVRGPRHLTVELPGPGPGCGPGAVHESRSGRRHGRPAEVPGWQSIEGIGRNEVEPAGASASA
jgi:hypothetical protein